MNAICFSAKELAEIGPVVIDAGRRLVEEHGVPTKTVARLLKAIVTGGLSDRIEAHLRFANFLICVFEKAIEAKSRANRRKTCPDRRDADGASRSRK